MSNTVRAKFIVASNEPSPFQSELREVKLVPVYSSEPGHENKAFWEATPSGEISLGILNPAAAESFEVGEEYYVDFSRAPRTEAPAAPPA